jgi:hypothetical protein
LLREGLTWTAIAAHLAALGVEDGVGSAPSGERVRKTWWSLRKAIAARTPTLKPLGGADAVAEAGKPQKHLNASALHGRPSPRLEIRTSSARLPLPNRETDSLDVQTSVPEADIDAMLSRVSGQLKSRTLPLPLIVARSKKE